ncbi:MAG TPA: hypothetical protein VGH87_09295 [Polyangiaceae bacterium]
MWTAVVALAIALLARRASADDCDAASKHPWVAVAADAKLGVEGEHVRRELRADLAPQAIDVCDSARAGTPIARIELSSGDGAVSIRLRIHDALTDKDVARSVSTENIPPDGRVLAIAVAASELLRASWAELALRSAPPPAQPVPLAVTRIVERAIAAPPPKATRRVVSLGVALAGETFTTGFVRLGADVRAAVDLGSRVGLGARVGFRRALAAQVDDGTVEADALVFGAEGSVAVVPRDRTWNLDVIFRADVAEISFHATPAAGVGASSATLTSVELSSGVRGRVALTPSFGLALELGGGGAVVGAVAKDGDKTVAGTNGALVFCALLATGKF